MKTVCLHDFLSQQEIALARAIYDDLTGTGKVATEISRQVIEPNLERINESLGQENDPRFLAYACEHTFMQSRGN
jgi:hypothetical protein